jgi:microcystin-dependent protein
MPFHSGFRAAALAAGALACADLAAPAHAEQSPYLGEVMFFTSSTMACPNGWVLAAGQMLQVAEHETLHAVIGTTYGGDGIATFGLPDLRGRIVRGVGQGPNLSNVTLGAKGGAEAVTIAPGNLSVGVSPNVKLAPAPAGPAARSGAVARAPTASLPTLAPSLVVSPCIATVGTFPTTN